MKNLFFVLTLSLVITAISFVEKADATQAQIFRLEDPVLEFNMQSDKGAYQPGEVTKLSLIFRNKGEADMNFCTFDIEHRLKESLVFATIDKKVSYKLVDWTKRDLPIVTLKDFILLKPGEEYRIDLSIETVFPRDATWRFTDSDDPDGLDWGQGFTKLSPGEYQIRAGYMNFTDYYEQWLQEKGYTTTSHIPVKNAWRGNLRSNVVTIAAGINNNGRDLQAMIGPSMAAVPMPDFLMCSQDAECQWYSGLPEKIGGCGCFNKYDMDRILREGFQGDQGPIRHCEPPPDPENACACVSGQCRMK